MEREKQPIYRFAHFAMGTTFEIVVAAKDKTYAGQVSRAVFDEINRIEGLFSRFNPCSEIGQINNLEPGQSLNVGIEVFECLETAAQIQRETNGAFDINIGSLLKYRWNTVRRSRKMSSETMQLPVDLSRSSRNFTVRVRKERDEYLADGVELDLGGIGKGYALDKIADILTDWSIDRALIHGGTSTALAIGAAPAGDSEKKGWPVGIARGWACPNAPKEFYLKDRALSGSGTEVKGKHVFDPRTGSPAKGHVAAWVSHPSAVVADALSTAFMVMSTEEVKNYCDHNPKVWTLVIIDAETCRIFNKEITST